jgi:hypothetical protein
MVMKAAVSEGDHLRSDEGGVLQPFWERKGRVSYPVPRNRERSLHTCAQDVQITRMATI